MNSNENVDQPLKDLWVGIRLWKPAWISVSHSAACYITMDFAMAALQIGFSSSELSLHKKPNTIKKTT
jgi:hypothetical protein